MKQNWGFIGGKTSALNHTANTQSGRLMVFMLAGLLLAAREKSHAANGSWTNDASDNWSNIANWNPNAVPGTAAGDVVSMTNNITAARTNTIESGVYPIIGTLNIGDSVTPFFADTLAASDPNNAGIFFNNGGNGAKIVQPLTTASDVISVAMQLQDNLTISNKSTLTISQGIFDDGNGRSLTKTGAGNLSFTGPTPNTYLGLTTVAAGTLTVNKSPTVLIGIPGDLLITNTGAVTLSVGNEIAPTANVTITALSPTSTANPWPNGGVANTVNNFTNNALTGSDMGFLTINGTLYVPMSGTGTGVAGTNTASRVNSMRTTTANTAIFSGGTIWVLSSQSGNSTFVVGSGGLFLNNASIRFGNDSAPGSFLALLNLNSDFTSSGTSAFKLGPIFATRANAQVDLGGATRNFNIIGGTTTIEPVIQNGGLNKTGSGILVLAGANSYTGDTTVTGGTLALSGAGALTSSQVTVTGSGFDLSGATNSLVINNNLNLNTTTLSFTPTLNLTNIVTANLNFSGASNTVTIVPFPGLIYPAQIHLIKYTTATGLTNANNSLVNLGLVLPTTGNPAGYLTNNAANGSLDLILTDGPAPLIPVTWRGNVNGNWDFVTSNWVATATPSSAAAFANSAQTIFDDTATGTTTVSLTTNVFPGSLVVSNSVKNYIFNGTGGIGGTIGLSKQGSGALVMDNSGTNNFTGAITIGNGVLQIGNGDANGNLPSVTTITDNGGLAFNRTDSALIVSNAIAGTGSITNNGSGTVTQTGIIANVGGAIVNNAGIFILGGANTYTNGATIINGGTIQINAAANMGDKSSPFTINDGTLEVTSNTFASSRQFNVGSANSTFQLDGTANLNPSGALTGTGIGGTGNLNVSGSGTLLLTGTNTYTGNTVINSGLLSFTGVGQLGRGNYAGNITDNGTLSFANTASQTLSGVIAGHGSLTKSAAGSLTLTAANPFTGKITVTASTLTLTGTASIASTNISLAAGGVLNVSGLTSPFTLAAGQTLTGTAATGTINGSANLGAGALAVTYTNGTPTLQITNGTLTLNNNVTTVTVSGTNALAVGSYPLIAPGTGGTVVGTVASSPVTVLGAGAGTPASLQIVSGGLNLVVAAASTQPKFSGVVKLSDNNFQLSFTGPSGQTYIVHATTNLTLTPVSSWPIIGTGTFSSGVNMFSDLSATNFPQQFYLITTP
jgi:fibronectin-binding autotransporter adhesin